MKPGPAPEGDDDSLGTAIQELVDDEVKFQVAIALATILDMVEKGVEQIFRAATHSAQVRFHTVMYGAVEQVILDQNRTAVLGKNIKKHVDQYFEAGKAVEPLGKRLLHNDGFLAPIAFRSK